MSQKLKNAVEAANILTDIEALRGTEFKAVVSACTSIIQNDIDSLVYPDFAGDRVLQDRLRWTVDFAYLVSAKAFAELETRKELRMLFRCVYDIKDTLEDRDCGPWSGINEEHWDLARSADARLSELRKEQAA